MTIFQHHMNRRSFLGWTLSLAVTSQIPFKALGAPAPVQPPAERSLYLFHRCTHEHFKGVYWAEGAYLPESLKAINTLLRDYRTGEIKPIDNGLLDLLYMIQMHGSKKDPLHIFSGYRSRRTNNLLRKKNRVVARNSFHLRGMAADITMPQVPLKTLRKIASQIKAGGVGYYPRSRFIHVDTGPVRFW